MDKYPKEMSGGMQQRVGIARAIALKPKVLLLDEPFGRLDSLTRMELQDVILEILNKEKITTVLVSHDVDEVVFLCDRVVMMTNGPAATIGEILSIEYPKPRDRAAMMQDPLYFQYLDHLISFLTERAHLRTEPRIHDRNSLLGFSNAGDNAENEHQDHAVA